MDVASAAAAHRPVAQTGDLFAADTQNARRDAAIRRQVIAAIAALRTIDHRTIMVSVSRGIVTLRGKVPTIEDRARIEEAARSVAGVRLVINQLGIPGPAIKKSAY